MKGPAWIPCSFTPSMGFLPLKVTRNPWPCRGPGFVVTTRVRVAASHKPSRRQEPGLEPRPKQLRGICFWKRKGFRRAPRAAAGSGRSEQRNVDTLTPRRAAARKPDWPQRSLRAQDRSRGGLTANKPQAPAPSPRHPTTPKICETDPFSVNRWDRPRRLCRVCCVNGLAG